MKKLYRAKAPHNKRTHMENDIKLKKSPKFKRLVIVASLIAVTGVVLLIRAFASGGAYQYSVFTCDNGNIDKIIADTSCSASSAEGITYRLYQGGLGRMPDQAGMKYWSGALAAGTTSPGAMVSYFTNPPTPITNTLQLTNGEFVTRLYQKVLGREPDTSGYNYWLGNLNGGKTTRDAAISFFANKAGVTVAVASDKVYKETVTGNDQFVKTLYRQMLGREADASGLAYWTTQLDSKTWVHSSVVLNFATGSEAINHHAGAFASYIGTLPRPTPTPTPTPTPVPKNQPPAVDTTPNPYACNKPYPTIGSGISDSSAGRSDKCVSAVQFNLRKANKSQSVTGSVDAATVAVIKNFQTLFSQPVNGTLTPAQVESIASIWGAYATTPTPAPKDKNPYPCDSPYPSISAGTKNDLGGRTDRCVSAVQQWFKTKAAQKDVVISGTADAATVVSIKNFQTLFKQPITGTLTPAQVEAIVTGFGELDNSGDAASKKQPNPFVCNEPYPTLSLNSEDTSDDRLDKCVSAVQFNLKNPNPKLTVTGKVDQATVESFKSFQKFFKQTATGILTPEQVKAIAGMWGLYATDGTDNGAGGKRFNITIVGASTDISNFKSIAEGVKRDFNTKQVMSQLQKKIKYNAIATSSDLGCGIKGGTAANAIGCDDAAVEAFVASKGVPTDKIIVIASSVGGRDAAPLNGRVGVSNGNAPVHEFGHLMGLIDEYVYSSSEPGGAAVIQGEQAQIKAGPNGGGIIGQCAADNVTARDWRTLDGPWSSWRSLPNVDFVAGCTDINWYRPSNTSLMAGTSSDYNSVSAKIISDGIMEVVK